MEDGDPTGFDLGSEGRSLIIDDIMVSGLYSPTAPIAA